MRITEGRLTADLPIIAIIAIISVIGIVACTGIGFKLGQIYAHYGIKAQLATTMEHAVDIYKEVKLKQEPVEKATEQSAATICGATSVYGASPGVIPSYGIPFFGFPGFGFGIRHRH